MKCRLRILVCDPINDEGVQRLKQAGFSIDNKPTIMAGELKRIVSNYDVLIVRSRTRVGSVILNAGTRLKAIGRSGAGLDNIDLETAQRRGITVLNTPEAAAQAVAELTLGLLLCLARSIPQADCAMKDEKWIKRELEGWQLGGKTLGTIGLGNVGGRVARLSKAFGMNVLIHKRTPPSPEQLKELGAEFVSLRDLLARSDVVTIHIPYTSETHHMVGEEELALMKKNAYIINTSRGPVIDGKALLSALRSGKLRGAALDVFEVEPPTDWTLAQLPNVVCTPHIGAQTEEAQRTASVLLAEKLINALS